MSGWVAPALPPLLQQKIDDAKRKRQEAADAALRGNGTARTTTTATAAANPTPAPIPTSIPHQHQPQQQRAPPPPPAQPVARAPVHIPQTQHQQTTSAPVPPPQLPFQPAQPTPFAQHHHQQQQQQPQQQRPAPPQPRAPAFLPAQVTPPNASATIASNGTPPGVRSAPAFLGGHATAAAAAAAAASSSSASNLQTWRPTPPAAPVAKPFSHLQIGQPQTTQAQASAPAQPMQAASWHWQQRQAGATATATSTPPKQGQSQPPPQPQWRTAAPPTATTPIRQPPAAAPHTPTANLWRLAATAVSQPPTPSAPPAPSINASAPVPVSSNPWMSIRYLTPATAAAVASSATSSVEAKSNTADGSSPAKSNGQPHQQAQANAAFMSRFQQPPPMHPSPIKAPPAAGAAFAAGTPARAPPPPTPLCRGHNLPMNQATCRKAPNDGQKFWSCPLFYSAPKEKCTSFCWDHDLATSGLRMQQRASNGEIVSEVSFSCDIVSAASFSVTTIPPDAKAVEFLKAEGGVADEKTANAGGLHQLYPPVWIFPLERHDALMKALEDSRAKDHPLWKVSPIPASARSMLLKDLQNQRLQAYASRHAETEASKLISSQLGTSPVIGGEPAAAAAGGGDFDLEAEPLAPAGDSKKKKRGGLLLAPKSHAASAAEKRLRKKQEEARHLTLAEETNFNLHKLPPILRTVLLPFQLEGVEYLTIQSLAVATYYHDDLPLLVICPSSLRLNWAEEIDRWLPIKTDQVFVVFNAKDGLACLTRDEHHKKVQGRQFGVVIISYDLATKMTNEIKQYKFGIIIADESHALKNKTAQRTRAIVPLLQHARRAILLSGTPAMNRPVELYTQITAIQPKLFPGHFAEFGMRYCDGHKVKMATGEHMDYNGYSHLRELHVLLKKYLLIRREKHEVLKQLPAKRRQTITLDIPSAKMTKLRKMREEHEQLLGDDLSRGSRDPHLTQYFKMTGEVKVAAVCEYISELIESDIKFLLYAHHIDVLNQLEEFVRNHKKFPGYMRIDGSTPPIKRDQNVRQFQDDVDCKVALLSITAAGTGLTLTAASHVVMAELNWTPAILVQAEDRVHRIGQEYSCNIHYLLARGTCDDLMWPLISKKLAVIGQAISGDDMHLEVSENRTYTSITHEQKALTGFYRPDQGMQEHDAPMEAEDIFDGRNESKYAENEDDEDVLFRKPDPRSAPNSGSSSSAAAGKPHRSPIGRPAAKKPRTLLHPASRSVASSSDAGGASSTRLDDEFPDLEYSQDGANVDAEDDEIDMTLTPSTSRSTVPTAAMHSASSVRSIPVAAPLPLVARRQKGRMLAALSSPGPPSKSTAGIEEEEDVTMESVAQNVISMITGEEADESEEVPLKRKRQSKRKKVISSDDDEESSETVADVRRAILGGGSTGSPMGVSAPAGASSAAAGGVVDSNRLSAEPEFVIPPSDEESDFEHVPPPEQLRSPPPVVAAPSPQPTKSKAKANFKPLPKPKTAAAGASEKKANAKAPPSAMPDSMLFPELEDEGDFLD